MAKLHGKVPAADQNMLAGIFTGVEVNFEIDTERKELMFVRSGSGVLIKMDLEEGEMPTEQPEASPTPEPEPDVVDVEPVDDEAEDEAIEEELDEEEDEEIG